MSKLRRGARLVLTALTAALLLISCSRSPAPLKTDESSSTRTGAPQSITATGGQTDNPRGADLRTIINFEDSEGNGSSVAFPAGQASQAARFVTEFEADTASEAPNSLKNTFLGAMQAGGYSYGQMILGLQLSSAPGQLIKIYNVRPIILLRTVIATGAVIVEPAGSGPTHRIAFDLDSPNPIGKDEVNGAVGEQYFTAQTIDVTSTDPQNVELDFQAEATSFIFEVAIDYDLGGRHYTEIVPDENGSPLHLSVTGRLCSNPKYLSPSALQQFRSFHYGEVYTESTDVNGGLSLIATDPNEFMAAGCD